MPVRRCFTAAVLTLFCLADAVQEIFRILCECAALNPDPDQAGMPMMACALMILILPLLSVPHEP